MIEEMHSCIDAKTSCQFHDMIYSIAQGKPDNDCLSRQPLFNLFTGLSAIGGHFNNPSPKIMCD